MWQTIEWFLEFIKITAYKWSKHLWKMERMSPLRSNRFFGNVHKRRTDDSLFYCRLNSLLFFPHRILLFYTFSVFLFIYPFLLISNNFPSRGRERYGKKSTKFDGSHLPLSLTALILMRFLSHAPSVNHVLCCAKSFGLHFKQTE